MSSDDEMESDDDSIADQPMPLAPLSNPIGAWLQGQNFEDLQEPLGPIGVFEESSDRLVYDYSVYSEVLLLYLFVKIQSVHLGFLAYLPKPVYGFISRMKPTSDHIRQLVEAAGKALPLPVDVSHCSLTRRKDGRPNRFPAELICIAKSRI